MSDRITRGTASAGSFAANNADGFTQAGVKLPTSITINSKFNANSVDEWIFVADRAYQVTAIRQIHSVAGGASAAVRPRKVTDTSAPGAAASATVKELTTAAFDLTAAANTTQTGTLSATATDLQLAAGDKIGLDFSGTLTALAGGVVTIALKAI